MRSVTEFPNIVLQKGLQARTALTSEGKSPEEVQASIGETFKMEGDKLKHFINAIEVASQNSEKIKRVLVVSYTDGENVPAKAVKVEEHHYLPEYLHEGPASAPEFRPKLNKSGGGKGRGERPKGSPWGLTPEEKAAKNKGGKTAEPKAEAKK